MSKLPFQWRVILSVVIFSVVGYVCYNSVIASQLKYLRAAKGQLASQEKLLQVRKQKAEDITSLQKNSEKLRSEVDSIKNRVSSDVTAADFLKSLPQLAKETDNNLAGMKFLDRQIIPIEDTSRNPSTAKKPILYPDDLSRRNTSGYFAKLPVQLTIRGRYANIIKLLDRLEDYEKLISIDSLRIETSEENLPEIDLHLEIGLYITQSNR